MSSFVSYLTRNEVESKKETFVSYVDIEDGAGPDDLEKRASCFFQTDLAPPYLPGEQLISEADSILLFEPFSDRKKGFAGKLFLTTFKLSFVTANRSSYNQKRQRNKLVCETDVPLASIDEIYHVPVNGKRKKLHPGSTTSSMTKFLEVHCKNFQVHNFSFSNASKEQNRKFVNALVHYAFPVKSNLLFAFDYGKNRQLREFPSRTPMYYEGSDWEREIRKCGCKKWWVTDVNQTYQLSQSMPPRFVVPQGLLNNDLEQISGHFVEKRVPTWSYTHRNGASLVRMAAMIPGSTETHFEKRVLSAIQLADQNLGPPIVKDLSELCPPLKDVQQNFEKLKELFVFDTRKEFIIKDVNWFSNLEGCKWLQLISKCLEISVDCAQTLHTQRKSVVVKEYSSRHFACLVTSLVQIMLRSECRTILGLQALIQREWVCMGYPFQSSNQLVVSSGQKQTPIFLLFLDCIWQMLQQFPSAFEFSETFLTILWDSSHLGLFETFLFDSTYDQSRFSSVEGRGRRRFRLPPVWYWDLQFSSDDQLCFNNPLYKMRNNSALCKSIQSMGASAKSCDSLTDNQEIYSYKLQSVYSDVTDHCDKTVTLPETFVPMLQLWSQCYLRWQTPAIIQGGGNPSEYIQQCLLVEEIVDLQHKIQSLETNMISQQSVQRPNSELIFSLAVVPPSSPIELLHSTTLSSSFPFSPLITSHENQIKYTPLSAYLENSAIDYDYRNADD